MHRVAIVALLVLVGAGLVGWWVRAADSPSIRLSQDLPDEADELVEETWRQFLATFGAQRDCLTDVELVVVRELAGGDAVYRRSDAQISILIPTSPLRFPESLVHELGHHLETVCDPVGEIGHRFLRAQGFSDASDWYEGETWFDTPSEHFAEAVVGLVRGERIVHPADVEVEPASLEIVRRWGVEG